MRLAKVESSTITNIILCNSVIPGYEQIPSNVQIGWIRDGQGGFINPDQSSPDITDLRKEAIESLDAIKGRIFRKETGSATLDESLVFLIRAIASIAMNAGTATPEQTAMLQNESSHTGQSVAAIANNTLSAFNSFMSDAGHVTGIFKVAKTSINNASTKTEIEDAIQTAITDWQSI